jgi:NCAIR mutase (PurE)-related protein
MPYEDLGHTKLDGHRSLRKGFPEVVYCESKTTTQVVEIMQKLTQHHDRVLGTRARPEHYSAVQEHIPHARYDAEARTILIGPEGPLRTEGKILVATGGTSDIPVAREAMVAARWIGCPVEAMFDVGVSGVHRLLKHLDVLEGASAIIAVAGMEGALPTVVAGLVSCPVIAVPTSVGYGAHFGGLAPLLTMLNTCATGVAVVNIDNGFGAGIMAGLIALGSRGDTKT